MRNCSTQLKRRKKTIPKVEKMTEKRPGKKVKRMLCRLLPLGQLLSRSQVARLSRYSDKSMKVSRNLTSSCRMSLENLSTLLIRVNLRSMA